MTYVQVAAQYADDVLSGEIPACSYVRAACQRFVDDLNRDWEYRLDFDEADKWCAFLEKLPHTKGKWAAKQETLKLSPWQVFCTVNIFGWRREDNRRRFTEFYCEVPRKNGKSLWVAGIGLGGLCIDNEVGAEIFCGANGERQAHEVFRPARQICQRKPALAKHYGITINAKTLAIEKNGSRFEPLVGNPGDGASGHIVIADEFHEHPTSDLVDTMVTGMGARTQPLMIYITTAGQNMSGPCYAKRDDVIKILNGTVQDESIFGIIYTLDDDDDWSDEASLIKANPNYDVSVSADFLKAQLKQARRSAVRQAAFKTKHLNIWVGAKQAWMNMLAYQRCRKDINIEDYKGQRCFVALDLASKVDIASMAILFPDTWTLFCRHYLPDAAIFDERADIYQAWHADGWITATPGDVIDYEYIEEDLKALAKEYEVVEVPYDPFQATQFSTRMLKEGLPMVEYGATVKNFSEPMKELEAKILTKQLTVSRDPVLNWMFGSVVSKEDLKGNVFPNKIQIKNGRQHIDGVVAAIMAMGRALFWQREPSPYEDHDLFIMDI